MKEAEAVMGTEKMSRPHTRKVPGTEEACRPEGTQMVILKGHAIRAGCCVFTESNPSIVFSHA